MESRLPVPDRETIVQYLAANDLHYQRIELPFGLATPGPDRSETAQQIFPADLGGLSVLDVGCYLGYFCHEARRRNAGRVVGVDVDETRLAHARALARFAGYDITFRRLDIEEEDLDGTFDIVLLLNVIHHARRPMDLLAKVARSTARQLVLEVPSVSDGPMRQYLRRHFRLRRRQVARLERLPVIGVGRDGALDGRSEQSFFFTPEAIRSVLLEHRRLFARVDVLPTARRGRFVAVAHRRRIGELVILAGPSGAGKTHLGARVLSGADPVLARRLGLTRQWLHARELAFEHPATGAELRIVSPFPADLQHALDLLRDE
jgi:SAM-dependent methyltransferase